MPGFAPVQKAPAAAAPARKDKKQAAAIQPKLSVNTPGDRFEKEADRTADKVMRAPAGGSAPAISTLGATAQRAVDSSVSKPKPEKQKVQRTSEKTAATAPKREEKTLTSQSKVQRATNGAKTLDEHTRELARDHERDKRVQRKGDDSKKREAGPAAAVTVQRDATGGAGGEPPSGFETTLSRAQQSGGETLSSGALQRMESGFARSFEDVRIHSDGAA